MHHKHSLLYLLLPINKYHNTGVNLANDSWASHNLISLPFTRQNEGAKNSLNPKNPIKCSKFNSITIF